MRRLSWLWCVVACAVLGLAGCDQSAIVTKMAGSENLRMAEGYVELLRDQDYAALLKLMPDVEPGPSTEDRLNHMRDAFPADENPISITPIGYFVQKDSHGWADRRYTFEYEFSHQWALVEIVTRTQDGQTILRSIFVQSSTQSLKQINALTFANKDPHAVATILIFIIFACGILTLCICATVICVRAKSMRQKWLWIIGCWISFIQVALNWTTGSLQWRLFWFHIPAVTFEHIEFSPWIFSLGIPVIAIIVLIRRPDLNLPTSTSITSDTAPTVPPTQAE